MKAKIFAPWILAAIFSGSVGRAQDYPGATWIPAASPNYEVANRTTTDVRWIVIHTTEGTTASAVQRFQDPTQIVSAHYIVSRDGSVIQMVRDKDIAYTAGNLPYNNASINIEHERYGDNNCTEVQLIASVNLVKWLSLHYGFSVAFPLGIQPADPASGTGIIGHNQVPDPFNPTLGGGASHHTDPINWDWIHYQALFSPTDTTPPTLAIDFPPDGAVTASSMLTVMGPASDAGHGNNGISSVTVNGIPASGGTATGANTAQWSATITLSPGPNTITVVAKDGLNNSMQKQISVTYNAPATRTLTVASINPTNAVTVSASPNDINGDHSGGTPLTLTYNLNTVVTVTVSTSVNGTLFKKFQMDGVDAGTAFVRDVTMDGDHILTAVYGSPLPQTVTVPFGPPPNRTIGEPPFTLFATASSGLPVSFSVLFGPATTSGSYGSTVTVTNTGAVIMLAEQIGNADYAPASVMLPVFWVFPPPAVNVIRADNNVLITWPTNVGGYMVETTSSLTPPISWSPLPPPYLVDGKYTVTNSMVSGSAFYRLRK
jgi:hypothetical protein